MHIPAAYQRTIRKRYQRPLVRPTARPNEAFARTMVDLLHLTAADTASLALINASHDGSPVYFFKALPRLWRAGYISKLAPPTSRALAGSVPDVLMVENGLAQAVLDAGAPLELLSEEDAAFFRSRAEEDRERVLTTLSAYLPTDFVSARLKAHGEQGRALVLSMRNIIGHATKNAQLCATILYGARKAGYRTPDVIGDKRSQFQLLSDKTVQRQPDSIIVVERAGERHAFVIETETGTQSLRAIKEKVDTWAAMLTQFDGRPNANRQFDEWVTTSCGVAPVKSFRVVFYGPPTHIAKIEQQIARRFPATDKEPAHRAGWFLTLRDDVVKTTYPSDIFRTNAPIPSVRKDATPVRCYDYYCDLLFQLVAGVVTAYPKGAYEVGYQPFFDFEPRHPIT